MTHSEIKELQKGPKKEKLHISCRCSVCCRAFQRANDCRTMQRKESPEGEEPQKKEDSRFWCGNGGKED